jgi:aminoglycoside 6'-N-acetyltransferase
MGFAGSGKRTVGETLSKETDFKLVHHHAWIDPILNLLGNDSSVWWELNEQGWDKINQTRDIIFSTIADICPLKSNFIITYEMIDQDPYHQAFYKKVIEVVEKRHSYFLPVRLLCDESELATRVVSNDRKKYFKTSDTELIRSRVRNKQVFITNHPHEITINNTNKSPQDVGKFIISALKNIVEKYNE